MKKINNIIHKELFAVFLTIFITSALAAGISSCCLQKNIAVADTPAYPAYPVGSVYISVSADDPAALFGGEWERVAKGTTINGIDTADADFDTLGETGGSKTHTLNTAEMPLHKHTVTISAPSPTATASGGAHQHQVGARTSDERAKAGTSYGAIGLASNYDKTYQIVKNSGAHRHTISHSHGISVSSTGGETEHNNMQPYYTVYIWERVA